MSNIEWTDVTWNPVTGCSKVSPGCAHCYAEALSLRFGTSKKPWTPENAAENVVLHPERLDAPLHWRKPRRVFVNSMSDLFHELVPDSFIVDVFRVMAQAEQHTFQVLTKRPERMRDMLNDQIIMCDLSCVILPGPRWATWPLPNVWLGVSVENQHWADERIPLLLQTPAAVRFISAEPLLGPVNLKQAGAIRMDTWHADHGQLDWVIVGGESGPKHRPFDAHWARDIRDQCASAGVPLFVKQLGARPLIECPECGGLNDYGDAGEGTCDVCEDQPRLRLRLKSRKGGDMDEWPKDLRIREFPQ